MRLGIIAYVIPFLFVVNPALLMIGSLNNIIFSYMAALIGTLFLAIALRGYLFRKLNLFMRSWILLAAICLFVPEMWSSLLGMFFAVPILVREWMAKKSADLKGCAEVVNIEA